MNYVDLPHTPRYCFGHGLSYTKFVYSDLEIENSEIAPGERDEDLLYSGEYRKMRRG